MSELPKMKYWKDLKMTQPAQYGDSVAVAQSVASKEMLMFLDPETRPNWTDEFRVSGGKGSINLDNTMYFAPDRPHHVDVDRDDGYMQPLRAMVYEDYSEE